ncbi:MAG: group 1 truncated hemoglobin [Bdellovibrionales bacterium]|nr:group 1 truncated hemoglobin [Ramlibacter sp.]
MNKTLIAAALVCAGLLGNATAWAQTTDTSMARPMMDDQLYKTFGEKPGLVKLMDDFMVRLLADARTAPSFKPANQQRIKEQLVDQFCMLTGGPCAYKGADMKTSHQDLEINKASFHALVEVLQQSMDSQGIPFRSQNQLLAKLAPMHRDIITPK